MALLLVDKLQEEERSGAYRAITDGNEFASLLTQQLGSVSHDGHLFVAYSPAVSLGGNAAEIPGPAEIARYRGAQKRGNFSTPVCSNRGRRDERRKK
jgi:hypothetical protein